MSISMMTIPLVDATAKYLSAAYSSLDIGWARYVVACLVASRHDRAFSERVSFLASRSALMFCVRCSIVAFRYGQASILAPLVYLELLGGAAIGFLVFGDVPDAYVWIGALTIIAGGSMTLQRSRPVRTREPENART